jgi:hydroxyethylthiazole kinase-like uncharacterized protein yjeF
MKPVVSVERMREIDERGRLHTPEKVLIHRAGFATYCAIRKRYGPVYGKRVVVVWGKGNNGRDARVAGHYLRSAGASVTQVPYEGQASLPECDLLVDGVLGTGFRGTYEAPRCSARYVVAVDIPSGIDGNTGLERGSALAAHLTVTFAAAKPGLLLRDGLLKSGELVVADIGLDCGQDSDFIVEEADAVAMFPRRPRDAHKWRRSLGVIAGSPGMMGAAKLCVEGAKAVGATMVVLAVPGIAPELLPASDSVARALPEDFGGHARAALDRCKAAVVGPGLGRDPSRVSATREAIAALQEVPLVVDADGLYALGDARAAAELLRPRRVPAVLTPHQGEFERLVKRTEEDVCSQLRRLASELSSVILLKGPTTVIASPSARLAFITSESPALATSGTGDVLAGLIGALMAGGLAPFEAAWVGAYLHQRASRTMAPDLGRASELPGAIGRYLADVLYRE